MFYITDKDEYIYTSVGGNIAFCGYGPSEFSSDISLLRWITLPMIDFEICKNDVKRRDHGRDLLTNMFCIGNVTLKFFADGDSGGEYKI